MIGQKINYIGEYEEILTATIVDKVLVQDVIKDAEDEFKDVIMHKYLVEDKNGNYTLIKINQLTKKAKRKYNKKKK